MVETELVTDDIASAERAIKALDEEHADLRSAFWLYDRDAVEYRFVLALPAVDREGVASPMCASWNQLRGWLRAVDGLRPAA